MIELVSGLRKFTSEYIDTVCFYYLFLVTMANFFVCVHVRKPGHGDHVAKIAQDKFKKEVREVEKQIWSHDVILDCGGR